ncbi:MAG: aminodeoxychorismate synthase component I [Pseudomonadales bacterium]|nr:aminodeoxychorismate synthase component I [Pseudomonadales bacterium]
MRLIPRPYHPDSSALMKALSTMDYPVFLDSGMNQDQYSRYDLLMADPIASLTQANGEIRLWQSDKADTCLMADQDIFQAVQTLLQHFAPTEKPASEFAELPFCGGAAGYFGYDLSLSPAMTSTEPKRAQPQAQQAPDAFIGIYPWCLVIDHHLKQSMLILRSNCSQALEQKVLHALNSVTAPTSLTEATPAFSLRRPFAPAMSKAEYQNAFLRLKDYIIAGDCYQANLAQSFSTEYAGSAFGAYLQLRRLCSSPFSAYIGLPAAAVLSFSPERFLSVRNSRVLTQPIKGTRRRDPDPGLDRSLADELVHSEKDTAENLMIVDLLRNDLGTLCRIGSVQAEKLFELQSFNNVHHLVSTISAELPPQHHPLQLLRNCFPGGSITGAPKIRAMQIIAELETEPRRIYCGSVAYIGFEGQMDSNIAIRSMLCENNQIRCWGGGGIVADSECEQEYQESLDKISLLINSLPLEHN